MKFVLYLKFIFKEVVIKDGIDMIFLYIIVEIKSKRMKVKDIDIGKSI